LNNLVYLGFSLIGFGLVFCLYLILADKSEPDDEGEIEPISKTRTGVQDPRKKRDFRVQKARDAEKVVHPSIHDSM
jgi:hypothetical protein